MNITGAIFDFDGTVFDSMHIWKGVKFQFFDRIGLVLNEEQREEFKKLFLLDAIELAKTRFDLKMTDKELFDEFFTLIKEKYLADTKPKNDIIEFLEKLKAKGVKMGIATATGEPALIAVLEKFNMLHYFEEIYSTYTVGASKTEPKVYDVVLNELGTEKETTWIFEDALYAAKTAKKAGYNVVGIYDKSELEQDELKNLVDIYIHNYSELNI
ncbi:MAG: HAD family phosphatase [Ruminococcaceae bacterium]|nr:HAD family phosphatase [Oscillospiraceae bacterium]